MEQQQRPDDAGHTRRWVIVQGRVQGVGFRYWAQQEALRLGVAGFARNRRDGSVEAAFSGPRDRVAMMLTLLQEGPPGARVDAIADHAEADAMPEPFPGERFSILPTV